MKVQTVILLTSASAAAAAAATDHDGTEHAAIQPRAALVNVKTKTCSNSTHIISAQLCGGTAQLRSRILTLRAPKAHTSHTHHLYFRASNECDDLILSSTRNFSCSYFPLILFIV